MTKEAEDKKKAPGRPKEAPEFTTVQLSKMVDLYSEGASDVEIKAYIHELRGSFSNDLWDRWQKEDAQFSETIKTGRLMARAWWEKQGRTNMFTAYQGTTFSPTLWYMNMKNRYGWADKTDSTHKVEGPVAINIVKQYDEKKPGKK